MKKIVLTAAIAFAAFSTVNAQVNANDETPGTTDNVVLIGSLGLVDMIDLVPEFQIAGNVVNTWNEYENGITLLEAWPNTPPGALNTIEFRVSATRSFEVAYSSSNFLGGGTAAGDMIPASDFTHTTTNVSVVNGVAGGAQDLGTPSVCMSGDGGYNRMFIVQLALEAGAAYDHLGGSYTGGVTYTATLVP